VSQVKLINRIAKTVPPMGPGQQHQVGANIKPPRGYLAKVWKRDRDAWLYGSGPDWNRTNSRQV